MSEPLVIYAPLNEDGWIPYDIWYIVPTIPCSLCKQPLGSPAGEWMITEPRDWYDPVAKKYNLCYECLYRFDRFCARRNHRPLFLAAEEETGEEMDLMYAEFLDWLLTTKSVTAKQIFDSARQANQA